MNSRYLQKFAVAAVVTAVAAAAHAETIRATSGFGPTHVLATDIYPEISAKLSEFTSGAWDIQDTPSGLVAPNEMSAGLRDGVTELGALLMPYFPAEFPDAALPSELSNLGSSQYVVSSAVTEYIVTCGDCQAEFTRNGQVYLGSDATPTYNILSVKPVRNVEDMKGLRIRTGAPIFAAFVEKLGGVPVQIPSSEIYESLSQGVIDGTFSGIHDILSYRIGDVIKSVTVLNEGVFNGAAVATASQTLWSRMSPDTRSALARASQYGISAGLIGYDGKLAEAKATEGVEFIEMDDTLSAAKAAFNREYLAGAAARLEARGVKDAQVKVDRYAALVEKWEGLVSSNMTEEQLGSLRFQEIWSKVDFANYGM
jgi:TRAP-type C4-dicarboxylate transport system substrate-binding protein